VFSPWRFNIDAAARRLLKGAGSSAPDAEQLSTGHELVDAYLAPLAKYPAIEAHIHCGHQVTAITRQGFDRVRTVGRDTAPFVLRVPSGDDGGKGVDQSKSRSSRNCLTQLVTQYEPHPASM
jgi:hypothetical protein